MSQGKKTVALIIMDGWGHREDTSNNAIAHAKTPVLDNQRNYQYLNICIRYGCRFARWANGEL